MLNVNNSYHILFLKGTNYLIFSSDIKPENLLKFN